MKHTAKFIAKQRQRRERAEQLLAAAPYHTVLSFAEAMRVGAPTARRLLNDMVARNRAYVWAVQYGARYPLHYYASGTRLRGATMMRVLQATRDTPLPIKEIRSALGIGMMTAWRCVEALHAQKRVHIARWTKVSRDWERLWIAGDGIDAPKPQPLTHAQKYALRVERLKADPEMAMHEANRKRASRMKPRRDPLTAALFGDAA